MANVIGEVVILSSESYSRKDGSIGYKVVAFYNETQPCVFFKDSREPEPQRGEKFDMVLGFDNSLKPVVRFTRKPSK